jgi:hypothetical protein
MPKPIPLTGFETLDRVIKEINEFDKDAAGLLDHEENFAGLGAILRKLQEPKQK